MTFGTYLSKGRELITTRKVLVVLFVLFCVFAWMLNGWSAFHQKHLLVERAQTLYDDLSRELKRPVPDLSVLESMEGEIARTLERLSREMDDPFAPQDELQSGVVRVLREKAAEWSALKAGMESGRRMDRALAQVHQETEEILVRALSLDMQRSNWNYRFLLGGAALCLGAVLVLLAFQSRELRSTALQNRLALSDLSESQARFRALAGSVNDYVLVTGPDLVLYEGFGKWFDKHGFDPKDLMGRNVLDFIGREKEGEVRDVLRKARRGEEAHFEYLHAAVQRDLFVQVQPLMEVEGLVEGFLFVSHDITELVEARERYRIISEASSDFAYSLLLLPGGEFRMEWISDAFKRLTGVAPEAIGGLGELAKLVHPEDIPRVQSRMLQVRPGEKGSQEYRYQLPDGRTLWIADRYRVEAVGEAAKRFIGSAQDITQEMKLKDILAVRDRQFRYAVENSSDILIHTDVQGNIEFISPAVKRLMGHSPEYLMGRHFTVFIHPEDQPAIQKEFQALVEQPGSVRGVRCRMLLSDGNYRTFEAMGWCQVDDHGEAKVYGSVRDVTTLLDAEKKWKALEQAAEVVDDGILILRSQEERWMPYYGNQGFGRLTGWKGPVEGFDLERVRFPFFQMQKWEDLASHLRRFTPWNGELKMLRANGEKWDCFLEAHPFQVGDDQERYMVLSFHDITETKKAQETLLKYERLATVGEISAGMAHEIKNPLAVIQVTTQNLQEAAGSGRSEELEVILEQCGRITRILQEVLDPQDRKVPPRERVVVADLICKALKHAKTQYGPGANGLQIEVRDLRALPDLLGRWDRLERVFSNLILNAFQAMGTGGRLCLYGKSERGFAKVTVRDSGHGIPEMDLGRIFEPFYTTKKHGSGMGLAVCQRIMEEHNGWISIERHLVGTAFEVWLPVPPDPAPPEGQ